MAPPSAHRPPSNPSLTNPNGLARPFALKQASKFFHHRANTPPPSHTSNMAHDMADGAEEENKQLFKDLYRRAEQRLSSLFGDGQAQDDLERDAAQDVQLIEEASAEPKKEQPPKKLARTIDEDDYDDDDEEEDHAQESPSKDRSANALLSPSKSGSSPLQSDHSPSKQLQQGKEAGSQDHQPQSSEDARKQLEEAKKATEEAAKRSFNTIFYTLEHDRGAMLEQQKLEESEKQIDAEMDHGSAGSANSANGDGRGSLSSTNLGASSLTLKHLIARIDSKRSALVSSDAELRSLMNEVRKNRSKWASEDNVNQEELYEAAEKVLSELKAMTEYSAPFLVRVNKREAPDYYNIIKTPMDLGTMTKKLKTLVYRSKADFVADLDLIWNNCLKYNGEVSHPLRRNANAMRKEADKLVPLIPDLVIRPRAEVEAEERRKQNGGEDDAGDDSDDEPIMSSRGRKTGAKGSSKARKTTAGREEGTPVADQKPAIQLNGVAGNIGHDGSDTGIEGSQNGFSTPPIAGSVTPSGLHGVPASQGDGMDIDVPSINGLTLGQPEDLDEDEEYKTWKSVTKKDRALVAKERNRLFKGDKLNSDEHALLRSKSGMRRWLRQQVQAQAEAPGPAKNATQTAETLAEGMAGEEERVLPDYYDPLSAIPDISPRLQWHEDADGQLVEQSEEFIHLVPAGRFIAPKSALSARVEANMKQMQETRKLCSKIGVIKQMQLQAQVYNNQFPKYEPEPFIEADIEPHVTYDDGPIMSPWVCRAALQRSVAKICYHTGFEELQPSALDVITDIAADYFGKLVSSFNIYQEADRVPAAGPAAEAGKQWQNRYTNEEVVLHTLNEQGLDVEALESYVKDDVERLGTKLSVMHDRMKAHLTDLLRPALQDSSADGSGAFNDGSEQFVGGDFAEELGEDFFGFKALGLDSEFGMSSLSVPLHLLQTRLHSTYKGPVAVVATTEIISQLPPLPPVTKESVQQQIGLVKNFFLAKFHGNNDEALLEDEDLTGKAKPPRPRLGPSGKILSPRKRPLKDQIGNSKKKKKLDNGTAVDTSKGGVSVSPEKAGKKAKIVNGGPIAMERADSSQGPGQSPKDDGAAGMMSPESIER